MRLLPLSPIIVAVACGGIASAFVSPTAVTRRPTVAAAARGLGHYPYRRGGSSAKRLGLLTFGLRAVEEDSLAAETEESVEEAEEETEEEADEAKTEETEKAAPASSGSSANAKRLGLLTFDLDDTCYPISPVLEEANAAFARAMAEYGFDGIRPSDIDETGRQIREEIASDNPEAAAVLTHTEIRMLAIRRQMESIKFTRSLEDVAEDWATTVSGLSPVIVERCRNWASKEVSPSVVQAVYNAWEMERHHAAERSIFPELLDVLQRIKDEHPGVVIGAVTDGKANPMLMPFTLAPHFDFCIGWEDDQGGRKKFFSELSKTESDAQLKWIYEAALEKYQEIASKRLALCRDRGDKDCTDEGGWPEEKVWIHVGDDLAYDVGGSAACGAKTVLMELADKYGQTARLMFSDNSKSKPAWAFRPSGKELENHKIMNERARDNVDATVKFISGLPDAINDILEEA